MAVYAGTPRPQVIDPMKFKEVFWPEVRFFDKQREIIYSVLENDVTLVPAGNMLGKDFVSGFIALWFFLSRHPCRIVTTSADATQLAGVLWGEIRRFIQTSKYPLEAPKGPLLVNHLHIRKHIDLRICGLSYILGRVSAKGEGLLGHHIADIGDGIPRTLFMADEASGVHDLGWERSDTWAKRKLAIGNCYSGTPGCTFFKKECQKGNILAPEGR